MTDPGEPVCWGCGDEPAIDDALGLRCRRQLAERRPDPATPKLNDLVERLDSVYAHLCWNCECAVATTLAGLCPRCHRDLRE